MAIGAELILVPGIDRIVVNLPEVEAVVRMDTEAIADGARAIAPVRTGKYRASITGSVEHTSEGPTGRVEASAPYAPFIEFGTDDTPTFAPITKAAEALGLNPE